MSNWKTLLSSALIFLTSASAVLGDCGDIAGDALQDGTWLFRFNGNWRPIAELNLAVSDRRSRNVSFAYVAREPELTTTRRGILIIKTGVRAPVAANSDRVTLAREAYRAVEQCESYPAFSEGSVKGRSYDIYHDYSYSVDKGDQDLIDTFHVSYPKRVRGCKRSNDDTTDSYFTGRWQSNRSQFSFDETVVANGQRSQFFAQFGAAPAYASPSVFDRKVEMKRYASDKNGLACVAFSVLVRPGTFIRINDLERRIGLFRATEQIWEWPR
jgi:hypothetical protein